MISWNKVRFIEEDGFDKTPEEMCRRINKFLVIRKLISDIALHVWRSCEKIGRNMHYSVDIHTLVKYNQGKLYNRNIDYAVKLIQRKIIAINDAFRRKMKNEK